MKKRVTSRSGHTFEVDTSDEACERFGVKSGDRILIKEITATATVVGVAGIRFGRGRKVLWYALDKDNGLVSYSSPFSKKDHILLLHN